jgi:hypothetical protein
LYRATSDFKRGHEPRTNIAKDQKGDLIVDIHRILARWRNHFYQLLNVHGVNDVMQTKIHTAEPLVPEPSASDIDQIPAELFKAGGRTIWSEIHKIINSTWNKEEMPKQRKESITPPIYKKGDKTTIKAYHFCQQHTKFYATSFCQC